MKQSACTKTESSLLEISFPATAWFPMATVAITIQQRNPIHPWHRCR